MSRIVLQTEVIGQTFLNEANSPLFPINLSSEVEAISSSANQIAEGDRSTIELAFVNSNVPDLDVLLSDLTKSVSPFQHLKVVVLDSNQDGFTQIAAALQGETGLTAIHFLTHGHDQVVQVGSTFVTAANLSEYDSEIQSWRTSLAPNGELMFYAFEPAVQPTGHEEMHQTDEVAGAGRVARSNDLPRNVTLNGDWNLEYPIGDAQKLTVLNAQTASTWDAVLSPPMATACSAKVIAGVQNLNDPLTVDSDQLSINISITGVIDAANITTGPTVMTPFQIVDQGSNGDIDTIFEWASFTVGAGKSARNTSVANEIYVMFDNTNAALTRTTFVSTDDSAIIEDTAASTPSIVMDTSAFSSAVTGASTAQSGLGAHTARESKLANALAVSTELSNAIPMFHVNGTNAFMSTSDTFTEADSCKFTLINCQSLAEATDTSNVNALVSQTVTSTSILPMQLRVIVGHTQPYSSAVTYKKFTDGTATARAVPIVANDVQVDESVSGLMEGYNSTDVRHTNGNALQVIKFSVNDCNDHTVTRTTAAETKFIPTLTTTISDEERIDKGNHYAVTATFAGASGLPKSSLDGVSRTVAFYLKGMTWITPPARAGPYWTAAKVPGSTNGTDTQHYVHCRTQPCRRQLPRYWHDSFDRHDQTTYRGQRIFSMVGDCTLGSP